MPNFPTPQDQQPVASPQQIRIMARIIWIALLMGQFTFAGVVAFLFKTNREYQGPPPGGMEVLFFVSLAMLIVVIPVGYFLRWFQFRNRGQDGAVIPQFFFAGTLLLLASCEGVGLLGLVSVMVNHAWWPMVLPTLVAVAIQLINFPTGSPMNPPVFSGQTPA